ncbi:MAG: aminotransferase class V-fold PLP-dependent enzyme [Ilumatobacteraceae bacterium]
MTPADDRDAPPGPWAGWAADRPPALHLHLDTAACGRSSTAVIEAVRRHLLDEAELGAYVAEGRAEERLERARALVGTLLGAPAAGVAFVESATAGRDALLAAWPLAIGATVAVAPSEWGPNLDAFAHRGLHLRPLTVTVDGTVDLDALAALLDDDPPDVVHLTHVASHRPLVQPVAAVVELARAAGVPVWVDAAQALGHVDTAAVPGGPDAVYANSRKWLNGPRGVGVVAVAEHHWSTLRPLRLASVPADASPVRHLESHEANIAGRLGFAVALDEHVALGPVLVRQRLADVGRLTREALAATTGWDVVGNTDAPVAITALRPTAGQDVVATRARLLAEHGIVTTVAAPARAPRELTAPLLRVSPYVDVTPSALARLRLALEAGDIDQA